MIRRTRFWFIAWLILCIPIWLYKPAPLTLTLELTSNLTGSHQVDAYYFERGKPPAGIAYQTINASDTPQRRFFLYPKHFRADGAVIAFSKEPSSWKIGDVGARASLGFFLIDAYRWPSDSFDRIAKAHYASTNISKRTGFSGWIVEDQQTHPRINLDLDLNAAHQTVEMMSIKVFCFVVIALALLLIRSGFIVSLIAERKKDHKRLTQQIELTDGSINHWFWLGIVIATAVLLFKTQPFWYFPGLHIEDSMEFSDFMSNRANLLSPDTYLYYRGYYVLISEWLGTLAANFPASWQAHLYLLIGSSMMMLAISCLTSAGLYNHKLTLVLAPTVLFFGAFTNQSFYITLTGTLFSATVLAMGLSLRPLSSNNTKAVTLLLLTVILIWSGPYGAQIFPFAFGLLVLFGYRHSALFYSILILASLAYAGSAPSGSLQLENLLDAYVRARLFNGLTEYVLLLNLFGPQHYFWGLFILTAIVGYMYALRKDRVFIKLALVFLVTGLSAFMTYFASFKYHQYQGAIISSHIVISQLCWLVFLLLCLDRLLLRLRRPTLIASTFMLACFIFAQILIIKDRKLRSLLNLPPDPELHHFLSAVDDLKSLKLPDGYFVQLWYDTYDAFSPTVIKQANKNAGATLAKNQLPPNIARFAINANFERQANTMLEVKLSDKTLRAVTLSSETALRAIEFVRPGQQASAKTNK